MGEVTADSESDASLRDYVIQLDMTVLILTFRSGERSSSHVRVVVFSLN